MNKILVTTTIYLVVLSTTPSFLHAMRCSVQTSAQHRYTVMVKRSGTLGDLAKTFNRLLPYMIHYILINGIRMPSTTLLATIQKNDRLSLKSDDGTVDISK